MLTNQAIIVCKRVKFYSPHDKNAFFEWIQKIKSIQQVKGQRDSILLMVDTSVMADEDLYNLVALCRRYRIQMSSLQPIITKTNQEQFENYQKGYSINVYPAQEDEK